MFTLIYFGSYDTAGCLDWLPTHSVVIPQHVDTVNLITL